MMKRLLLAILPALLTVAFLTDASAQGVSQFKPKKAGFSCRFDEHCDAAPQAQIQKAPKKAVRKVRHRRPTQKAHRHLR